MPRKLFKSDILECIVCGANKENVVTLFSFPKCPERKQLWMESLEINNIKFTSRVCEKHFRTDQFVRTLLKKDAIPSKNIQVAKTKRIPLIIPGFVNIMPRTK